MDIVIFAREQRMWLHNNFNKRVARRTAADPRAPLAGKPQKLAVTRAGRDGNIDGGAVRERDASRRTIDRLQELDGQAVMHILPAHLQVHPAAPAEQAGKKITLVAEIGKSF